PGRDRRGRGRPAMNGIVAFGAYVPRLRLQREAVVRANAWFDGSLAAHRAGGGIVLAASHQPLPLAGAQTLPLAEFVPAIVPEEPA
ncbi:MAG: hypothetical protein ACT6R2_09765, partial [Blastomonas fulva]